MTGKIDFQTGKAILLPVEFQEFQAILDSNKRYCTGGKCYWLLPEKENTAQYLSLHIS